MNNQNLIYDIDDTTEDSAISEVLTVDQVKDYLRLEGFTEDDSPPSSFDFDDDFIEELITDARETAEDHCGVSIIGHEWTWLFKNGAGDSNIPYGPYQTVVSLTDSSGNDITSSAVLRGSKFKMIECPTGDKMTMVFTAGYVTVPKGLLRAMKQMIAYWYFHRGDEAEIQRIVPEQALASLSPFVQSWKIIA